MSSHAARRPCHRRIPSSVTHAALRDRGGDLLSIRPRSRPAIAGASPKHSLDFVLIQPVAHRRNRMLQLQTLDCHFGALDSNRRLQDSDPQEIRVRWIELEPALLGGNRRRCWSLQAATTSQAHPCPPGQGMERHDAPNQHSEPMRLRKVGPAPSALRSARQLETTNSERLVVCFDPPSCSGHAARLASSRIIFAAPRITLGVASRDAADPADEGPGEAPQQRLVEQGSFLSPPRQPRHRGGVPPFLSPLCFYTPSCRVNALLEGAYSLLRP